MQAANVHQMFEPDQAAMLTMVSHLFADQMRGLVELAWTAPMQRNVNHGELFALDRLDEMVERGAALNAERRNVYIGAALRKENTPPFGRTSAKDFFAATALWGDLDDLGGTVRAAELCKSLGVRPTLAVITGRHPHERGQLWWRLDNPWEDAGRLKTLLGKVKKHLVGDSAVVDPITLMRWGGSVAWPVKDGREN
jgi:hypothetical protein